MAVSHATRPKPANGVSLDGHKPLTLIEPEHGLPELRRRIGALEVFASAVLDLTPPRRRSLSQRVLWLEAVVGEALGTDFIPRRPGAPSPCCRGERLIRDPLRADLLLCPEGGELYPRADSQE